MGFTFSDNFFCTFGWGLFGVWGSHELNFHDRIGEDQTSSTDSDHIVPKSGRDEGRVFILLWLFPIRSHLRVLCVILSIVDFLMFRWVLLRILTLLWFLWCPLTIIRERVFNPVCIVDRERTYILTFMISLKQTMRQYVVCDMCVALWVDKFKKRVDWWFSHLYL